MNCLLQPLGPNIVVRLLSETRVSPGGIQMPETAKGPTEKGEVLAVGSGFALQDGSKMPLEIRVGDVVYFPRHAGGRCEVEGEELRVMSEREVFARIRK